MNAPEGAKERLISNYCEELEKTLEDVHCNIASKINIAQRRQKKGYDDRSRVDDTLALEPGDRVWLHVSLLTKANPPTNEPAIHHNEEVQPPPEEKTTPLRRSTRCRRPPDRYQDFNLEDIQIEDALI